MKDGGYPSLYDTATVVVNVLDVNDNSPVFKDITYHVDLPENGENQVIHSVLATDRDSGPNGQISYSIIGE